MTSAAVQTDIGKKAKGYWCVGLHFLQLAELASQQLVAQRNALTMVSDAPIDFLDYHTATAWSDFRIGVPILFNFLHGIEVTLKGFLHLAGNPPKQNHGLTKLCSDFSAHFNGSDIATISAHYILSTDPNLPLSKFFAENNLSIDRWHEALRYPETKGGDSFTHMPLMYSGLGGVEFWSSIEEAARQIRLSAVALAEAQGY